MHGSEHDARSIFPLGPVMSRYQLNKAMWTLTRNPDSALRQRFAQDPQAYSHEFDLTDEERRVFCDKDIAKLYSMGVQPFILLQFALLVRGRPFTSNADL